MSGLLNSGLSGSSSNLPDNTGRAFSTSFSAQSASTGAVLNQSGGSIQGLHNIHGSFNMSNIPGTFASRNSSMIGGPPSSVQQAAANVSNGRYAINTIPNALSQLSLGGSHGSNGGSGVLPNLGNAGRIQNSIGNLVGGANIARSLGSGGGSNLPGLASRLNLASPQMVSMLGNSYSAGGIPLSQNQFQAGNNHLTSMALLNELNSHDNATFDMNEFPQLNGRPNSAGGSQGQLGLMRKQNVGFNQQNQEFSIQNEDFPALPGYKGGNAEFPVTVHQKEQLHDNMASMMQSQHLAIGRSAGFNLGGTFSSHHHQQQQPQHAQSINGNGISFLPASNQDIHFHGPEQYQQFQKPSQFRFVSPFRDQDLKSMQASQPAADRFGMLGLLSVIRMINPALTSLALGIDLTTLGLNLNSSDNLHKKFASPWSEEPVKGEPEYTVPECYYAKQPPALSQLHFVRFRPETLFYIFYSMPKEEAQLYAANELYARGWFYHRDQRAWFTRVRNMEPLVKTNTYERGYYFCFDPNKWETVRKDNFVLQYEAIEKRPALPQQ